MSRYLNIHIDAGADFSKDFDIYLSNGAILSNTTGFSANGAMKTFFDSVGYIPFVASIVDGKLRLEISGDETADIKGGTYVYDAFVESVDQSIKVIEGKAFVTPKAT